MSDAFDGLGELDGIELDPSSFTSRTTQGESADKIDAQQPIKKLLTLNQSSIDILEKLSVEDVQGYGDVARAAIYMLGKTTPKEREEAYRETKIYKQKRGRKKGGKNKV